MAVTPDDLALTLVQRFRRQRDEASSGARLLQERLATLASTITANGKRRAWLIGSLAKGTWGSHSDVDIVVADLSPEHFSSLERTLEAALGVSIDLLRFEQLEAAFRARIECEGLPIHVA